MIQTFCEINNLPDVDVLWGRVMEVVEGVSVVVVSVAVNKVVEVVESVSVVGVLIAVNK